MIDSHPSTPRLLFVTPRFGRGSGGLGVSAERVVGHLRSRYSVQVLETCAELPPLSLRELTAEHWQLASAGDRKLSMQFLCDVLLRHAGSKPVAVLVFYAGALLHPAWLAAQLLGAPLLAFARGNDVDLEPFGAEGPALLQVLVQARGVVCVTRELQRKVQAWAPGARTLFVPNGVEVDACRASQKPVDACRASQKPADACRASQRPAAASGRPRKTRVGIFGDLKTKKGLDRLLAELDPQRFHLDIVGTLRPDMEKLLHGMLTLDPELARSVTHHPFVASHEALLARYAAVDVVCVPSTHEGMSNVMLEAMAQRKIVVASRVGGALDVITHGHDGLLFDVYRDGALGECLRAARDAPASLGEAAEITVRTRFSAEQERTRTLAAVGELLGA